MPLAPASLTVPLSDRDPSGGIPGSRQDKTHVKFIPFCKRGKKWVASGSFLRKKMGNFSGLNKKPALDQISKKIINLLTWPLALEKRGLRKTATARSAI
ncbi:hypothetical protein SD961_13560 [Erwinia sp. MMLR14_017]|uniref:hypothetical protein n=1 Tax=Erwinia sp. MMLR14_017 TaxID=3093842 RepID=UPI0029907804|nr:hypothetical protein [Erwinia sp. MMLR14_017]MDW8846900.1 hypothetical protein [Erwinia sp. MMLR14_017]